MSFFSSLQQYVTSGVAGLGLNSRRFSLSRQDSAEHQQQQQLQQPQQQQQQQQQTQASPQQQEKTPTHGFPKVLPTPGTIPPPQQLIPQGTLRRQSSRGLECLQPPQRSGSFRQRTSPVNATPPEKPPLAFCRRRSSWPEIDPRATSGVKESDGAYFETFTALSWQRENWRMEAIQAAEARAEIQPVTEREIDPDDDMERPEDKEELYIDVLYTIANTVGAQVGQFTHYKEEMFLQAQRAFGVSPDRHYRLLHAAAEEKPKIIVLSVVVLEAEGLEAKDANGFSDPYCMLGIQPMDGAISPQPPLTPRTLSDTGMDSLDSPEHNKLRKHHSFRLSFKRKEAARREQRDSVGPVPAKFIRATSVKPHTLCPKWNEKFKFDIDDMNTDQLHLDIWDHDDESNILDAVSRLNEVRGVRGLGRFFKQVCQSARQGSQDDFLGSVNIPIQDIPSTGLEGWFKLEARSQRSSVQGRIRLKVWLSTRDDTGTSEEENAADVIKLERLHMAFMTHELVPHEPTWTWSGDIPGPALTILHQMAVQADLTDLQCSLARFVATVKINKRTPLDPKFIHRQLLDVDRLWNQPNNEALSRELEQWLAEAMTGFVDKSLNQMRRHREIFPALHSPSMVRLEFLLRCLGLLGSMRAFRQVSPFSKGVRGEIVGALRKGSVQWAQHQLRESQRKPNPLVFFATTLVADLQIGLTYYHSIFDNTNGIQYFSIVYKQFDNILTDEVSARMETGQFPGTAMNHWTVLDGDREPADTKPFEIYFAFLEFDKLKQHLSVMPQPPEKTLGMQNYYEWFEAALQRWLTVSKAKTLQRVRTALALDQICEGEKIVRHSTSSVDIASCFYQLREFWRLLAWPEPNTAAHFESQIIEAACSATMHYADLIHQKLADSGYYEQTGPFRTTDEMCVTVNNLEYVRRALSEFRPDPHCLQDVVTDNLLESTLLQLEARSDRVLGKLSTSMQGPLQKAVFHLAWSPDSLPANQAIVPLLEYLDVHLSTLNSALLSKNFNRALTLIWNAVLHELSRQMDTGGDSERPANFHDRLYDALQLMVDFFNAEGLGLPLETLHCDAYWRVKQRLQYHKTDTERLIDMFYVQRLQEQLTATSPGPYGTLAVRAYFNHDSLCVEILHARDVIPLDPNGFSDPFVIIELLPRRIFAHCAEQQTNVHKKTLNPIFDECFEFSVTLEQCSTEGAMVAFTVMDHDVLTANDFAGEAFLALGTIPGVADYSTSIDNFHGLKQIDLPLMQQKVKNHPILQILESRIAEKLAVEFVRKQKSRLIA